MSTLFQLRHALSIEKDPLFFSFNDAGINIFNNPVECFVQIYKFLDNLYLQKFSTWGPICRGPTFLGG